MFNDLSDAGIVLQASTDGSGSFYTVAGKDGVVRTLSASHWIASNWFPIGQFSTVALTISGVISTTMASVKVAIECRRKDANNPGATYYPAILDTIRTDAPSSAPAAYQTIAKADLQRGAGTGTDQVSDWDGTSSGAAAAAERLDVRLLTTDAVLSGECRVLLLATGTPQSGDVIRIAVNRG